MITVHFLAYEKDCAVEFESTAETEPLALKQGREWAEASKFTGIRPYCVSAFIPPGIHNIVRTPIGNTLAAR